MHRSSPAALLAALTLLLFAPAGAHAADVFETVRVPVSGGETIHVEVARPEGAGKVPIILTLSPYNTLNEGTTPNLASDALYATFGPKGYARAVADVLGTRNSTGCWDYGGRAEQQAGVDLVNALSRLPWSNGKVAMIGGSYDGTTATMVAARGGDVPGLAAIVPQAAISRWYGYAYQDGVRYFLNSEVPTDEGFDTPLAFDFGLARTPPTQPEAVAGALPGRVSPCAAAEHTARGYDRTPDYDAFWVERDYLRHAADVRVPALVTHGWQDFNVKQSEGTDLYAALTRSSRTWEKLFVYQGAHGAPGHEAYATLLERFFARTLKGERNGIEREAPVWTEGRRDGELVPLRTERAWPPAGTRTRAIALRRDTEAAAFTDLATSSEETLLRAGGDTPAALRFVTEPLRTDVRLAGSAVLDLRVTVDAAHGQLAPTLFAVAPDGTARALSRGFLDLRYRDGLEAASPVPAGEPLRARVRLAPQDETIPAGHRLGVLVAGSNVVWAVPDTPGVGFAVATDGSSKLRLPVAGARAARTPAEAR